MRRVIVPYRSCQRRRSSVRRRAYRLRQRLVTAGEKLPLAGALLILVDAITRPLRHCAPGNGFLLLRLGVRGRASSIVAGPSPDVAPFAMLVGECCLPPLPVRQASGNAAHLTRGRTFVGLMITADSAEQPGGGPALAATCWVVRSTTVLLPVIVNGTLTSSSAIGQTIAWVDRRLTLRWESIVYLYRAALAVGWLGASRDDSRATQRFAYAALALGTTGSLHVLERGARRRAASGFSARQAMRGRLTRLTSLQARSGVDTPARAVGADGICPLRTRAAADGAAADTARKRERHFDLTPMTFDRPKPLSCAGPPWRTASSETSRRTRRRKPGSGNCSSRSHGGAARRPVDVRHSDTSMYRQSDGDTG